MLHSARQVIVCIQKAEMLVAAFFVATMSALLFFQVALRVTAQSSIPWVEEYCILALVWATFLGASIAYKSGDHLVVVLLPRLGSRRLNRALDGACYLIIGAISATILWTCLHIIPRESEISSFSLPLAIPRSFFFSVPTAVAFASMLLTSVVYAAEAFIGRREIHEMTEAGVL